MAFPLTHNGVYPIFLSPKNEYLSLIDDAKMHGEGNIFAILMKTYWPKETVDLYLNSELGKKYFGIMNDFFKRGLIKGKNG